MSGNLVQPCANGSQGAPSTDTVLNINAWWKFRKDASAGCQAESTIIFRFAEDVDTGTVKEGQQQVTGNISGGHRVGHSRNKPKWKRIG